MRQHLLAIIAVLAAAIIVLFSINTEYSGSRYGYGRQNVAGTQFIVSNGTGTPDADEFEIPNVVANNYSPSQEKTVPIVQNDLPSLVETQNSVFLHQTAMMALSPSEIPPLDAGMVNVTANSELKIQNPELGDGVTKRQTGGYRISLPVTHSEFQIAIPYDPALLPQGFTEDDIQTYVYNSQYHRWVAIQRDSVNEVELLVYSRFSRNPLAETQNFSSLQGEIEGMMSFAPQGEGGDSPLDFINAVLKTPEMPETSAYTPTSIKELKAADPLEGLTLMQPPTANNSGTANLSYPIEIPAGRQGMQPNLALTYSSSGGNGWLGVGWDIPIPSITVETRWGVPRYDQSKESEVYVYEGEQLVTFDSVANRFREMPHRTNHWTSRSVLDHDSVEQFYPRKNEAFDSIVRHGAGPNNYWWTVTHKNGVTDYYGKHASDSVVNNNCVLRAGADNTHGPIAHWALAESVDPFGNSVRYYYQVEYHRGTNNSPNVGRQIYIDTILYTAKENDPGKYRVVFTRQQGREDISIAANKGFKEVTASTLCNIAIGYNNRYFKFYVFETECGRSTNFKTRLKNAAVLHKTTDTLLNCVSLGDIAKDSFACTHFDYFNYPESTELFSEPKTIMLTDDTIKSTFATGGGNWAKATALGGTRGKSWNIGGTATVGVGPVVPLTTLSVGGNFNYSRSKSEGALTLIDLDGDGLADKVYKKRGKLYYRKHVVDSEYHFHYDSHEHELMDYSDVQNPRNLNDFLSEVSSTTTWGLQLSLGLAYSGSWPTTKSTTSVYFADVNADGLPDLITDDGVLFNVTERDDTVRFRNYYTIAAENSGTDKDSTFVQTITDTCGGIIFSGEVSDSIVCQTDWVLDTTFTFSYTVTPENENLYAHWFNYADSIDRTNDHKCVYIYCDDRERFGDICEIKIYKKTIVSCDPFPTSTAASDILERDPDLETVKVWVAPNRGTVTITSDIRLIQDSTVSRQQSKTCDGVFYAIQLNRNVIATPNHRLLPSTPANISILATDKIVKDDISVHHDNVSVSVSPGDLIFFRLISGKNHDYDNVEWNQTIQYVGSLFLFNSAKDFVLSGNKNFGAGAPGNSNKIDMSIKITTKNLGSSPKDTLMVIIKDTCNPPHITIINSCALQSNWTDSVWYPLAPANSPLVLSQSKQVIFYLFSENPAFPWEMVRITPHINYYIWNNNHYDTVECYPQVNMVINNYDGSVRDTVYHRLFGPLYKGWGQFAYHNNDTLPNGTIIHDDCIHLEKLISNWDAFPDNQSDASNRKEDLNNYDMQNKDTANVRESSVMLEELSADTLYSPLSLKTSWVEMQPDFQHQAWVGYGNVNYVTAETMCNTRMPSYYTGANTEDIEDYDHPVPVVTQGLDVKTVRKQNFSKMKNHSLSLSAPIEPFSTGASVTKGYNLILTDYMDMNGDRYPDVLGPSLVQYSQPWGGIGDAVPMGIFANGITCSDTKSGGINFGGSFEMPSRGASNNPKNSKISFDGAGNAGASHGGGEDETSMTWMDMNADGLPDKVVCENEDLKVYMNTGYGFLNKDTYNTSLVRKGKSNNTGLNLGGSFNIGQASIGGGIGVNWSKNITGMTLMDFNADGIPDIVVKDTFGEQDKLKVKYAKGNGDWTSWETFPNLTDISFGRSYSESVDASVTVGFTFLSIIKLCVGISGSPYNRSFSKDSVQLTDINGDGYVDYVTSQNENSMIVRYNQAAKTNLLKKVTNFTGSSFELDYDMPLACYEKPQRSWNLSRVETRNNVDTCPVGGNRTLTSFAYESPNYNRLERMDYGYQRVTTYQHDTENNDEVYRFTVEDFNNSDFTKRGRKTRDCVYDAYNNPYVEHIYGDTLYDYAGNIVDDGGCARTDVYVKSEVDITNWYEGGNLPQITSATHREYDRYRNVERYVHYGDITHTDEYFTAEIKYAHEMPHNLTALPVRIVVTNHSGDTMQKRTADYHPDNGKLTVLRLHNYGDTARYDFIYDSCGNMERVTMPANSAGQRLVMKYHYDNTVHTYPVQVENYSLGYSSSTEYDLRFGKPTKTTDINGNEMWYEYDNLGRTIKITAPYEQIANAPYSIKMMYYPYNYNVNDSWHGLYPYSYACTYHYDPQHPTDPIRTTVITDGLGRLMQTKKDAEIGGQEVSIVTGRTIYDCFGRTVAQYQPFTEDTSLYAIYNDSLTVGTETVTEYDMMDRQTLVTQQPYGYETYMYYGFDIWNGKTLFFTETTDPNGNAFAVLKGTLGQQMVQIDPSNNATVFYYDALGRLTESVDPDTISTYYEYDKLGRMTLREHPDAGKEWYCFDPAGNLVYHVNGNGDTVRYNYYYNLLTNIYYPNNPANNVRYVYGMSGSPANTAGKIVLQEDASGWQTFKYGKLGEVTENIRTFALPNEPFPYTFKMKFFYDSWNRIDSMIYPDGEVVSYDYNRGGMLKGIRGNKNGNLRTYVRDIRYNRFELKDSVAYGNGTRMRYEYDSLLRLSHLHSWDTNGNAMQHISYTYDSVGNITNIANSAAMLPTGMGGEYQSHYSYDQRYRLTNANGGWDNDHFGYELEMQYADNGRILSKLLDADLVLPRGVTTNSYRRNYRYTHSYQPNTVTNIYDEANHSLQYFTWDEAGNMIYHQDAAGCERRMCWDEENRLMSFTGCDNTGFYQYDAGGERTYKLTSRMVSQNILGQWNAYQVLDNPTLYASPYLVATEQGYTKHYYAESERIASRIGGGLDSVDCFICNMEEYKGFPLTNIVPVWGVEYSWDPFRDKRLENEEHLHLALDCVGADLTVTDECLILLYKYGDYPNHEYEPDCYWYHPDHLGSSSWVTAADGEAVQHLHYLPWGEDFVDQRLNSFDGVRYTFSAKERDSETGLSYFGSRYYSSDLSIWLSVDPMAAKYPSLSPYVYCADNPVKLVDPNGEEVVILLGELMKESDRQNALNDLRNAAPNLKLELEGNNLIIGDGGTAKTKYEKQLANAISSTEVKSVISLELIETTGSYYGTDLIDGQYVSNNSVNPYKTNDLEKNTGSVRGCGLMHEITEGYEMGKIAKRENLTHIEKAWRIQGQETIGNGMVVSKDETGPQRQLYEKGHRLATPQPGDWRAKPKRFFNEQ